MGKVAVGKVLDGFCDGAFGRDSYGEKLVVGLGSEWVVVRDTQLSCYILAQGRDVLTDLEKHVVPDGY